MDPNEFSRPPEADLVLGSASDPESPEEYEPTFDEENDRYEPGFFARVTMNRPLVILLVIAFLLLVLAPWLFYALNPPHPRPSRPVPRRVYPTLNEDETGPRASSLGPADSLVAGLGFEPRTFGL